MRRSTPAGIDLHREERGSATVFAVVFVGLLVAVTMVAASVAGLLVAERRAAAGADLAALAGASAVQRGEAGCQRAGRLAAANGVRLVRCASSGEVVTVEVATDVVSWWQTALGSGWTVRSRARAGPVS